MTSVRLIGIWAAALLASASLAQLDLGTTDASDGDIDLTGGNLTIDLNRSAIAAWNAPSGNPGFGNYDGNYWAIFIKVRDLIVPAGRTLRVTNRLLNGNPPVVFLVQRTATIDGAIDLNAGSGATPGPGGFAGGEASGNLRGSGRGPGGAGSDPNSNYSGAGHAKRGGGLHPGEIYGSNPALPLVGGSGAPAWGGLVSAGGGGAILIAAKSDLTMNGSIRANGGYYMGSGGTIRLVADRLVGGQSGVIEAIGGLYIPQDSAPGRVRLEANTIAFLGVTNPLPSIDRPTTPVTLFPPPTAPLLQVVSIAGISAPSDPNARFDLTNEDVTLFNDQPVTVRIRALNVPANWRMDVRVAPRLGQQIVAAATKVSENGNESFWEASITFPRGQSAIQARAYQQ